MMTTISLWLCLLTIHFVEPSTTQTLRLEVENITSTKGQLWFGVYDSEQNFLDKANAVAVFGQKIDKTGALTIKSDLLKYGTYAIAVFHDINNNGELDTNMWGVPKEPYAFSNPPKSKWRAPLFDEVKFTFNQSNQQLKLRLENW